MRPGKETQQRDCYHRLLLEKLSLSYLNGCVHVSTFKATTLSNNLSFCVKQHIENGDQTNYNNKGETIHKIHSWYHGFWVMVFKLGWLYVVVVFLYIFNTPEIP